MKSEPLIDKRTGRFLKKYENILTEDLLKDLYLKKQMTVPQIGKKLDIPATSVMGYLKYYKIQRRKRTFHVQKYNFSKKFLINEYINKRKSAHEIAKEQHCDHTTILKFLKKYNIPQFSRGEIISIFYKKHPEKIAVKKGVKRNPEIGKKVSKAKKGFKFSEESKKKMSKAQKGEKSHSWIDGRSFLPYPSTWTKELKAEIRDRDNYECQNCGMTEEEHLIVYGTNLDVHHIDSNKMNCDKNNLISLCKQCHSRTLFNRDYWLSFYQKFINSKDYLKKSKIPNIILDTQKEK